MTTAPTSIIRLAECKAESIRLWNSFYRFLHYEHATSLRDRMIVLDALAATRRQIQRDNERIRQTIESTSPCCLHLSVEQCKCRPPF